MPFLKTCLVSHQQEINFSCDLLLGTSPISKAPHQIMTIELPKLKIQFQELLDLASVRPNVSPCGAATLFVNKDRSFRLYIKYHTLNEMTIKNKCIIV